MGVGGGNFFGEKGLSEPKVQYIIRAIRGCSSVVERHVANVNVVSSNLITRFNRRAVASIGELPAKISVALVSGTFQYTPFKLKPG